METQKVDSIKHDLKEIHRIIGNILEMLDEPSNPLEVEQKAALDEPLNPLDVEQKGVIGEPPDSDEPSNVEYPSLDLGPLWQRAIQAGIPEKLIRPELINGGEIQINQDDYQMMISRNGVKFGKAGFNPLLNNYVEDFEKYQTKGDGIIFIGPSGSRKSQLAADILVSLLQHNPDLRLRFIEEEDYLELAAEPSNEALAALNQIKEADLLILDGVSPIYYRKGIDQSDWGITAFEDLIQERHRLNKPMILTIDTPVLGEYKDRLQNAILQLKSYFRVKIREKPQDSAEQPEVKKFSMKGNIGTESMNDSNPAPLLQP